MIQIFGAPTPIQDKRPVVTLGMFDGVHVGHQAVIGKAIELAHESNQPAIALTFDIHPRTLFGGAPAMITSLEHRLTLLEKLGLDTTYVLCFDHELAKCTANDFAKTYFRDQLHAAKVVLGFSAHFGANREGDGEFLRKRSKQLDLDVFSVPAVVVDGENASSTAIRKAVGNGNLDHARDMLGRPVSLRGTVVHGRGVGTTLGYPTLNIDPHHELRPPTGVYITRAVCGQSSWQSVTNIGTRPTFQANTPNDILAETFLFDFSGELYGQTVEIELLKYLRGEKRFKSPEALTAQINHDVGSAKHFFTEHNI